MPSHDQSQIPVHLRSRVDAIAALTDAIAARHLDAEYAALCRRMAEMLARRRPSPLERGEARTWAAGIVHAVGWANFLTDPSQEPHLSTAELAAAAGVGQSTLALCSRTIRDALDLVRLDPAWTRPSRLADNPLAWMILVDGLLVDARGEPREIQEEALRRGLIPFLPPSRTEEEPWLRRALDAAEDEIERTLAANPSATVDELNAALASAMAGYSQRPQVELGGLSPVEVQQLLDADWEGATSAIRLESSATLDELEPAPALHDARLVLAMLAEQGSVKATPKGNLPRAFVAGFHGRMRPRARTMEDMAGATVLNEEDLGALHRARILLELAGLVKRRKGLFSRTRRGEQLTDASGAGALFATLVRAQFRRLDLAWLDGLEHAPGFQLGIGFTLHQFGRVGGEWRKARDLVDALVLPSIRRELPVDPYFDAPALMLETRFLRPLVAFGLAEARETPREADELLAHPLYRKAPLFDQVVRFRLASGAVSRPGLDLL